MNGMAHGNLCATWGELRIENEVYTLTHDRSLYPVCTSLVYSSTQSIGTSDFAPHSV